MRPPNIQVFFKNEEEKSTGVLKILAKQDELEARGPGLPRRQGQTLGHLPWWEPCRLAEACVHKGRGRLYCIVSHPRTKRCQSLPELAGHATSDLGVGVGGGVHWFLGA